MGKIAGNIAKITTFVQSGKFRNLLVGNALPAHVNRHRMDTIASRIKMVSITFAILTLIWIPIDILLFRTDQWELLVGSRVVVTFIFFAVAMIPLEGHSSRRNFFMLVVVLANSMVLHCLAHALFADSSLQGFGLIISNLYAALPYVVVTGLALFPLIALETILLSAPVILLTVLLPVYTGEFIWTESASQTWIMGLLLGVSVLSGMIQTYYMEALLRRADHDPLTDAITRRSGVEIIEFLFRLSIDKEAHLSLAFVDLDHFKSLNDNYGHDAGDEALKQVVHTLNKMLREADTVIRWGGEEFVLVLPETPMDGAKLVMDRIVSNWFATRPDGQPLTASIGVAELQNDSIQTWEELVELADKRMYTAKESGRAQYVCT